MGRAFVDTNVLLYAFDPTEPAKQRAAQAVLSSVAGDAVVSAQVLGEFYVNATRKLQPPLTQVAAAAAVRQLMESPVVSVDAELVRRAIELQDGYPISYWDALVVASAASAGCDRLLTEDLADGDTILGVRIENPFRGL